MAVGVEACWILGKMVFAESDHITGSNQEENLQFEISQKRLESFPRSQNGHMKSQVHSSAFV